MRIWIDEDFYFEIELAESINLSELAGMLDKLTNFYKFMTTQKIRAEIHTSAKPMLIKEKKHTKKRMWARDRATTIELLNLLYHGTKEERVAFAARWNELWQRMANYSHSLRRKWDIKPEEVGLARYPGRGEIGGYQGKERLQTLNQN